MIKIDCLGDMCPIPILHLQKEMDQIKKGETVLLITDHSCTKKAVEEFCKAYGFKAEYLEAINGVWEITIQQQSLTDGVD